jgi:hypothetical protein
MAVNTITTPLIEASRLKNFSASTTVANDALTHWYNDSDPANSLVFAAAEGIVSIWRVDLRNPGTSDTVSTRVGFFRQTNDTATGDLFFHYDAATTTGYLYVAGSLGNVWLYAFNPTTVTGGQAVVQVSNETIANNLNGGSTSLRLSNGTGSFIGQTIESNTEFKIPGHNQTYSLSANSEPFAASSSLGGFSGPYATAYVPAAGNRPDRLYVTNRTNNTVSIINLNDNSLAGTLTGFDNPQGIAYVPAAAGRPERVYVANNTTSTISIINVSDGSLAGTLAFPTTFPRSIAYVPAGANRPERLYIGESFALRVVDLSNNSSTALNLPAVFAIAYIPAGANRPERLYMSEVFSSRITIINPDDNSVITRINNLFEVYGIAYVPAAAGRPERVYVTESGIRLGIINPDDNSTTFTGGTFATPAGIAYASGSVDRLYVANFTGSANNPLFNTVSIFNPNTNLLSGGTLLSINFNPGLESAVTPGTPLIFSGPKFFTARARLPSDAATNRPTLAVNPTAGILAVRNNANIFIYRNIIPTSFNGTNNVTVAGTSIPPFTTGGSGVGYYNITSNPITVTATTSQISLYYRANTFSYLIATNNTHQFFLYLINVDTTTGTITTAKATFSTNTLSASSLPRLAAVSSLGGGNVALFVAGNALDLLYRFSESLFDGTNTITFNGVSIPHSSGYAVPATAALIRLPHGSTVGQVRAGAIAFNPTTNRTLLFSGSTFNYDLPLASFDGTSAVSLKTVAISPTNNQYSLPTNLAGSQVPSLSVGFNARIDLVDPSRSILTTASGTLALTAFNRHTTALFLLTQRFASAPAITKPSANGAITLASTIDAYQAIYLLTTGSQLISFQGTGSTGSYSNGEYYPYAYTPTDDAAGTIGENFTLSGISAAITGIYRLTMASGTTLTLSGKATYSDSFTLLSGSTLAIAQDTTITADLILSSGTTVTRAAGASGDYTLTIPYSGAGITAGTGITIAAPQVALSAPNFADGTRVYAARVQSFTIASTAINTTTNEITLGTDAQGNAAAFATAAPWTQVRFSLNTGANLPTTTGSVLKDGGFYYWSAGKLYTSIANISATPIDFTSQGSGNFTLLAETELVNTVVSGNNGYSQNFALPSGALIRLKATRWTQANNGAASASTFFDTRDALLVWSATGGASTGAAISATTVEPVHEAIVAASGIQSNKYGLLTPENSGFGLSQFDIALEGVGTLQINSNDIDGVELIQNIFLWWCWVRSTEAGIRLASFDTLQAINFTSYQAGRVEVENTNSTTPLNIAGGSITFPGSSTGIAATSFAINLNADVFGTGATVTTGEGGGGSLTDSQIRNAVWNATLSNHNSPGTTGRKLADTSTLTAGEIPAGLSAQQVWEYAARALTDKADFTLAPNAITSGTIDVTAVTEIQSGLATPSNVPTPAQIAAQVRTELATELARIDLAISTRLATAGYTTPPTTNQIAAAVEAALLNDADGQKLLEAIKDTVQALFDAQADVPVSTLVSLIAAQITADHGSGSYTTANLSAVALEASVQAIKAKTDNLPSDPADQSELVTLINTRLAAANYVAPSDTAVLAAIQLLPTETEIADAVWDEPLSGHTNTGTTGAKLNLASTLTVGDIPEGLTAAQVWSHATRELTGTQATNLAAIANIPINPLLAANYIAPDNMAIANTLSLVQASVTGRFKINYPGKAFQYNRDGTLLQEFNLLDAQGNPAISAQTAVDRVPVGEANPAIPVVGLSGLVYWS